jgi:hypothetical protein
MATRGPGASLCRLSSSLDSVLLGKSIRVPKRPAAAARRSDASAEYWKRASLLLAQREQLVTEIEFVLASRLASRPLARKAAALLTRFWSGADWDQREDLLLAARWLMRIGKLQPLAGPLEGREESRRRRGDARRAGAKNLRQRLPA